MEAALLESNARNVRRGMAWTLALFFLLILGAGMAGLIARSGVREAFAGLAHEIGAGWAAADALRARHSVVRFAIVHFDDAFGKATHWPDPVIARWQKALWSLGVGNEDVVVGREGWLEYQPAMTATLGQPFLDPAVLGRKFRPPGERDAGFVPDPRPAMITFHRDLAARGIALWILPAPSKTSVHPEMFAPTWREVAAPLRNASYERWVADLAAAGVEIVDPMPLILAIKERDGRAYLRNDSHWSPAVIDGLGAELARRAEAAIALGPRDQPAWRQWPREREHPGDLLRILRLPPDWVPEKTELLLLRRVGKERWQPDPAAEVLLIGDSFAKVYAHGAGLTEALCHHLGRQVDRIAFGGAGALGGRRQLADELAADPRRLDGKKLVIWEFAERDLATADWQVVHLPPPTDPAPFTTPSP